MRCWHCDKPIETISEKIGFRASCIHCSSDLHVCKNCRYHVLGKPNNCMVPGTDPIQDPEKGNFCEEFRLLLAQDKPASPPPKKTILGELEKKKDFDSLFKDT